jgi:hypothetical protein
MYGLIKTTKSNWLGPNLLSNVGGMTALAVAFASLTAAFLVIATAFTGSGVA